MGGGGVIAPATSTTQNFLHKIVIKFLGHKNQNWHCWSPFSKQLVQSTPPHPPSLIGLMHTQYLPINTLFNVDWMHDTSWSNWTLDDSW